MRAGIAALREQQRLQEASKVQGDELLRRQMEDMRGHLQRFKDALQRFAAEHRNDIQRNPAFRAQFHEMCSRIGVDPLASQKGWWNEVLGFGDFYYELAVQVAEVCLVSRSANGGLIELQTLLASLRTRRNVHAPPISEDDIRHAVNKLQGLGQGFKLLKIGKNTFVQSVPKDLKDDYGKVLSLAEVTGFVRVSDIIQATQWPEHQAVETLEELLGRGLCMVDDGDPSGVRLYWVVSLMMKGDVGGETAVTVAPVVDQSNGSASATTTGTLGEEEGQGTVVRV